MSAVQSHSLNSRLLWESRPKSKSGLPVSAAVFLRSEHFYPQLSTKSSRRAINSFQTAEKPVTAGTVLAFFSIAGKLRWFPFLGQPSFYESRVFNYVYHWSQNFVKKWCWKGRDSSWDFISCLRPTLCNLLYGRRIWASFLYQETSSEHLGTDH